MAVLTTTQLAILRREFLLDRGGNVHWTKAEINAVFQAIEDVLSPGGTAAVAINNAAEAAAPGEFSGAEKVSATKMILRLRGV